MIFIYIFGFLFKPKNYEIIPLGFKKMCEEAISKMEYYYT